MLDAVVGGFFFWLRGFAGRAAAQQKGREVVHRAILL
jgi:hypothetical protein